MIDLKFKEKDIAKNKDSGITLMALVVTIIILLILAGISIGMLSGDNSIIKQAGNAKTQTDIAQEKEILEQATVVAMGKSKYGNIDEIDLKTYIDSSLSEGESEVTDNNDGTFLVVFPSKRAYEIDENGNVSTIGGFNNEVSGDAVARIKYTYYTKLQDAIDAVPYNNTKTTIVLLKNLSENVIVSGDQNIVLNLNTYTLTNTNKDICITLNGILNLKNGKMAIDLESGVNYAIKIENTGKLILNDIEISSDRGSISNYGVLEINNSKVTSSEYPLTYYTIYTGTTGSTIVNSGYISNQTAGTIRNYGILKLNGGTIESGTGYNAIKNETGGTVTKSDICTIIGNTIGF